MSFLARKILQRPHIPIDDSSSSNSSKESYKDLVDARQLNQTIGIIKNMKIQAQNLDYKLKQNKDKNLKVIIPAKFLSDKFIPLSKTPQPSPTMHQKKNIEFQNKKRKKLPQSNEQDEYLMKQFYDGKRAHFEFMKDNEQVQLFSNSFYLELKENIRRQRQLDMNEINHQSQLNSLIIRSQQTLLKYKLNKNIGIENGNLTQEQIQAARNRRIELIKQSLYMARRQSFLINQSKNHEYSPENRALNKNQSKAIKYIQEKLSSNAYNLSTLSKSLKLKPLKITRQKKKYLNSQISHKLRKHKKSETSEPEAPIVNINLNYKELEDRQKKVFEIAKQNLSKKNREYLQSDLKEISNFLNKSLL